KAAGGHPAGLAGPGRARGHAGPRVRGPLRHLSRLRAVSSRPALLAPRRPRRAAAAAMAAAGLALAAVPGIGAAASPGAVPPAAVLLAQRERSQDLESTVITPETSRPPGFALDFPRRKPGLWEVRNAASENLGMPPTRFCVGEETDTARNHLGRAAGDKGSRTIGP